jgi:Transposase IS4
MIRLRIVKTKEEEEENILQEANEQRGEDDQTEDDELHGTMVFKYLVEPWCRRRPRVVCADSYFASVRTAEALFQMNLRFIGVVKTATKRFPMDHFRSVVMGEKGDRKGLISLDASNTPRYLSIIFVDRDRRYFIATTGSLEEGTSQTRKRWRQVAPKETNQPPEKQTIVLEQPRSVAIYYETCARIDQHNRDRQSTLKMERKFHTTDWSSRVNTTIFAMILVDCWKVYSQLTFVVGADGKLVKQETQKEFYGNLAAEMIDNTEDIVATRRGANATPPGEQAIDRLTGLPMRGIGPHLSPTKRRRVVGGEIVPTQLYQGHCVVCAKEKKKVKTTECCSVCRAAETPKEVFLCTTKNGKLCFSEHLRECHDVVLH